MSATTVVDDHPTSTGRPTATDRIFFVSMIALTTLVVVLGRLTFQEGVKTETTKSQAEALVNWMQVASAHRAEGDFQPAACVYRAARSTEETFWRDCVRALHAAGGPLAGQSNAFTGAPVALIERCNPSDLATAGQIMIEKISPTPPGSAVPVVVSAIADDDRIGHRLTLRITACDKGGYPIRIGEAEF